jgi:hypothetical protein
MHRRQLGLPGKVVYRLATLVLLLCLRVESRTWQRTWQRPRSVGNTKTSSAAVQAPPPMLAVLRPRMHRTMIT